jgi:hypothetical protein
MEFMFRLDWMMSHSAGYPHFQFPEIPVFAFLGDLCFSPFSTLITEVAVSCVTSVPEDIHNRDNVKSEC